jgi:amphiphysin
VLRFDLVAALLTTPRLLDNLSALFTAGAGFGNHYGTILRPIGGEYDLLGKHPDAEHTIRSVPKYESTMEEMKSLIAPELELIDSRIVGPTKEFQSVLKTIRKTITKRDHKVSQSFLFPSGVCSPSHFLPRVAYGL